MKANLNLFLDLMSMPDKSSKNKEGSATILNSFIWSEGKLQPISSQPEEGVGLHWETKHFSLGSKGRIMMVQIQNISSLPKKVKVFFEGRWKQPFQQYAYISPENDCIFIYNQNQLQLVNGTINGSTMKQCAVFPVMELNHKIRSDLKRGKLHYQPIAKGIISSMFSLETEIPSLQSVHAWAWAIQGNNNKELLDWNHEITKNALAMS